MQNQIGEWSADGDRLLGVVNAGLDEEPIEGQRPGDEVVSRTPAGVLGTVGQLADAITFLGSRHAAYVTGTGVHALRRVERVLVDLSGTDYLSNAVNRDRREHE